MEGERREGAGRQGRAAGGQASSVSEAQRKESLLLTHKKASFLLLSASWPLPLEA